MSEKGPDLDNYNEDLHAVTTILDRYGISKAPDRLVTRQMEAWYNNGDSADAVLYEASDAIIRPTDSSIEMSAVMSFGDNPVFRAPEAMWGFVAGMSWVLTLTPLMSSASDASLEPSSLARTPDPSGRAPHAQPDR